MKILIDNGHGFDTPGKRSPDGKLLEYAYNRFIAEELFVALRKHGYDPYLLVPESSDISLRERVRRANAIFKKEDAILISIHVNASGNGKEWMKPTGWSCYTSVGDTKADDLAEQLCLAAEKHLPGHRMRWDISDGDRDQERDFYILRKTHMPAVLTENLYMDAKADYDFLLSDEGRAAIVALHVEGLVNYLNNIFKSNAR